MQTRQVHVREALGGRKTAVHGYDERGSSEVRGMTIVLHASLLSTERLFIAANLAKHRQHTGQCDFATPCVLRTARL